MRNMKFSADSVRRRGELGFPQAKTARPIDVVVQGFALRRFWSRGDMTASRHLLWRFGDRPSSAPAASEQLLLPATIRPQ